MRSWGTWHDGRADGLDVNGLRDGHGVVSPPKSHTTASKACEARSPNVRAPQGTEQDQARNSSASTWRTSENPCRTTKLRLRAVQGKKENSGERSRGTMTASTTGESAALHYCRAGFCRRLTQRSLKEAVPCTSSSSRVHCA